jgi:hypothetical protein
LNLETGKVRVPLIEKLPLPPLTTPWLTVPSPQLIVALKLLAGVEVAVSVNVATTPQNDEPWVIGTVRGVGVRKSECDPVVVATVAL